MLPFCVNQQFHANLPRKSHALRLVRSVPLAPLLPVPHILPLSPIFRIFFQVPYPATPLFATVTKTAGVGPNNSQLQPSPLDVERTFLELANRNNHSRS